MCLRCANCLHLHQFYSCHWCCFQLLQSSSCCHFLLFPRFVHELLCDIIDYIYIKVLFVVLIFFLSISKISILLSIIAKSTTHLCSIYFVRFFSHATRSRLNSFSCKIQSFLLSSSATSQLTTTLIMFFLSHL